MFKIGIFSKITNLTIRALHHYEELGLLLPAKIDPTTNYRYYSAQQLTRVNQIKMLQQIGLPLKTIKDILQDDQLQQLNYYYELREHEIQEELNELKKKQKIIQLFKENMKAGNTMEEYNVALKEIPARKVMSIRQQVAGFADEGLLWNNLHEEALKQQVKLTNPPTGISIYHDKEYRETNVEIEVQSTVVGDYADTETVKFFEAPKFTMASVTFNGSYEKMTEVMQTIALWMEANNYVSNGPMINISYVSPAQDPNPDNWVTEAGFIIDTKI